MQGIRAAIDETTKELPMPEYEPPARRQRNRHRPAAQADGGAPGSFVAGFGLAAVTVPLFLLAPYYGIRLLVWISENLSPEIIPAICGSVSVSIGLSLVVFSGRIGRFVMRQLGRGEK